ncbi:hypothetical protein [Stakelama saccharophila]|uniref:Uncharacterized protein n=1 Tax=Stakelama saccharophila TaxID=3075605 RepID=A0ABZ0B8D0_9SPHN|nr:hypothetical protein [Stakelama sp. W311]WNO52584.1 hypothetical protein RPR59_08870 [Stakelama sp. W311]
MLRFLSLAVAIVAAPAMAQDQEPAAEDGPPQRVRSVVLYGDDKCPEAEGDEIVVCAKAGDSPYRIPEKLREKPPEAAHQAWSRKVEMINEVNRAGLPNSCSPVGTGGQTGCTSQMLRNWARAQREKEAAEAGVP